MNENLHLNYGSESCYWKESVELKGWNLLHGDLDAGVPIAYLLF